MIGFIVKHSGFGLGKIRGFQNNQFTVDFFFPTACRTLVAIIDGRPVLKRALLPLNTLCSTAEGPCRITKVHPAVVQPDPHRYQVEFESGLAKEIPEVDLTPKEAPRAVSPLAALSDLELEGYSTFQKREVLSDAWWSSIRGALGLRALLSSRIDLRPHQAYVAGTILMDRLPRYLLADEVGLGKTIEAGIVIHDLLERKPSARILIICPDTLTQQWLCELFAKFSGRVFHLLELRGLAARAGAIPAKTIASFTSALLHSDGLLQTKWDLIVIDEAHHLLSISRLYRIAHQLSEAVPGCLLLSAVPAQRREEEYLRLLALLEPQRYKPDLPGAKEHFKQLYERQIELGRKLSYLSRRLGEFASGTEGADRILQKIDELTSLPVLARDEALLASAKFLNPLNSGQFVDAVHTLLHHIGDRYRISRRILRNRRSQLLDVEPELRISRRVHRLPHQPDQLERNAGSAARRLILALRASAIDDSVLFPFARYLFHSLCDPACLSSFVALASSSDPELPVLLEFDGQVSYHSWEEYVSNLWGAVRQSMPEQALQDLEVAAQSWLSDDGDLARMNSLVAFLRARHRAAPKQKFLIFAGFFGLGQRLAKKLVEEVGSSRVDLQACKLEYSIVSPK